MKFSRNNNGVIVSIVRDLLAGLTLLHANTLGLDQPAEENTDAKTAAQGKCIHTIWGVVCVHNALRPYQNKFGRGWWFRVSESASKIFTAGFRTSYHLAYVCMQSCIFLFSTFSFFISTNVSFFSADFIFLF